MEQKVPKKGWIVWLVAASFVQFQFILQLGSGILISSISSELGLSALYTGLLSSCYYYIYVSLQTPSGMLCDRYNVRNLLTAGALVCALGCFLFAKSHSLALAFFARILTGAGAACAFVAMITLIKQWFSAKKFAAIIGLSEAVALVGTIVATILLSHVINYVGWRNASLFSSFIGLLIALLCWLFIEEQEAASHSKKSKQVSFRQSLKTVLHDRLAWLNALYIGIGFAMITVYAALWSIPFLETKLGIALNEAALITSFIYLGAIIGCPTYGVVCGLIGRQKPLLYFSCLSTALVFTIMIYLPTNSLAVYSLMNLLLGLCCSSYMLAFSISNHLAPKGLTNTYTGFTNAISVATAPCLQPLIGYLLDLQTPANVHTFTVAHYQHALMILPVAFLVGGLLLLPLPDARATEELESCVTEKI
jgi:MFS family permease